ncbi:MAG TPA: hypothetical protein VK651_06050 [Blastocatellia bacterium]|nr:hypothetical protein [Blastocatellia bacterium]
MTIRVVLQIFCASVLASTAMMTTPAQTPAPTQAERQRGIDPEFEQRQRDLRLVDKLMGAHETTKTTKTTKRRDPKIVAAELEEDFTGIQVVNNDLAQAVSGSAPLNLEFVVKSTAELVEHARRLGENLGHPEPEKGSKPPKLEPVTDVEQLKRSLATLDKLITEFAHNPLFTDATTRDAELFVKAHRDLAEISALSEHIKKNAVELSKVVKQSP